MAVWVRALLGIAFGLGLLWIALAQIDLSQAADALLSASPQYLLVALVLYWSDIAVRIFRWRTLLSPIKRLSYHQVGRALIVGYAVNNVLPARLGEIFRADFVWRQYAVRRSSVLGSIVIERLLDGLTVVGLFGAGLLLATTVSGQGVLITAAITGAIGLVVGIVAIFCVLLFRQHLPLDRIPWLKPRILALAEALEVVRGPEILRAAPLSLIIWALECATFYFIVAACGIEPSITGLWIIVGAASLSTLLPSAPGFIGSLQIAFVLAFAALGFEAVPAVVAAVLTQLVLLGSVTLIGLATLSGTYLANARRLQSTQDQRGAGDAT